MLQNFRHPACNSSAGNSWTGSAFVAERGGDISDEEDDEVDAVGDKVTDVDVPFEIQFVTLSFKCLKFVSSPELVTERFLSIAALSFILDMLIKLPWKSDEISNSIANKC